MKKILLVLMGMALVLSSGQVWAKDGFYLGMDLGVAVAPEMDVQTGGIDSWTPPGSKIPGVRCDPIINPGRVQTTLPDGGDACKNSPGPWGPMAESFDGGSGILAGLAVGYRLRNFRVEGEYFYRNANYDSTDTPTTSTFNPATSDEYGTVRDAVDDVLSHNFFANLYYDYRSDSKFTPYLGIGIGLAKVSVAYRTLWQRTTDPAEVKDFKTVKDDGTPDEDGIALNQKLAGALTHDRARMSDTLFGYQALAGVDYQVSEPLTIGLKFRWADFGGFEDESEYTELRGHTSVAGKPYYIKTDDIQFWGVSLNMKYQF